MHTAEYKARVEAKRAEQTKQMRIAEIKAASAEIDFKSIRAIRENGTEYIAQYTEQAQELRVQLQELMG